MPFKSEAQRRWMFANEPDMAHAWAHGRHTTDSHGRKMPSKDGPGVRVAKRGTKRKTKRK